MTTMHDELLGALQSVASVRLLARLRDPRLSFPGSNELRVFIPDLHLLSSARRAVFQYGTNLPELLTSVLKAIAGLKSKYSGDGTKLIGVYQVGDLLDLWREAADAATGPQEDLEAAATRIENDNAKLIGALYHDDLGASFILGNHDFDLYRLGNYSREWQRRLYLMNQQSGAVTSLTLHGDVFDWIEKVPEVLRNWFVYFFHPAPTTYDVGEIRQMVVSAHAGRDYAQGIQGTCRVAAGADPASPNLPDRFNVHGEGEGEMSMFLPQAYQQALQVKGQFGIDLRSIVIGHTHHARIAVKEEPGNGNFFALIDCGAWIENCTDGSGNYPNAQVAALSDNEARIYQLGPAAAG